MSGEAKVKVLEDWYYASTGSRAKCLGGKVNGQDHTTGRIVGTKNGNVVTDTGEEYKPGAPHPLFEITADIATSEMLRHLPRLPEKQPEAILEATL